MSDSSSDDERSLWERFRARLLAGASDIPSSALGRLGRTAAAAVRTAWLLRRRGAGDEPVDPAKLAAIVSS
jgi:hypothetical protein